MQALRAPARGAVLDETQHGCLPAESAYAWAWPHRACLELVGLGAGCAHGVGSGAGCSRAARSFNRPQLKCMHRAFGVQAPGVHDYNLARTWCANQAAACMQGHDKALRHYMLAYQPVGLMEVSHVHCVGTRKIRHSWLRDQVPRRRLLGWMACAFLFARDIHNTS